MTNRRDKIDEYANKLKKWDERIVEAEKNLAELTDDMKDNAKKEIENLKAHIKDAKEKLNRDNFETDNIFDELNKGLENNWKQLQETMKNVYSPLQ